MVLRTDEVGNVVREGEQVEIGGNDRYTSVCRKCFKEGMANPQPGGPTAVAIAITQQ